VIPSQPSGLLVTDPQPSRSLTVVGLLLTLLAVYVLFQVRLVVVLALLAVLYATAIERPVRAGSRADSSPRRRRSGAAGPAPLAGTGRVRAPLPG